MATRTRTTANEYLAGEETEQWLELLDGQVVVNEPRPIHGLLSVRISTALHVWCTAAPGRGLVLPPIDVRMGDYDVFAPDLCWIAEEQRPDDLTALFPGIPDLCVEIRSPGTWRRDLGHKKRTYEERGAAELWLVDTQARTVLVYRRSSPRSATFDVELELTAGDVLGSPRLPGFGLPVDELFDGA
ncbi:MAG: Uma2 family endonuclease [Solirubrobacteraceae bacterium]|nr:Uma2 family endonuclease [Solirubrobacteraceae bacterium]